MSELILNPLADALKSLEKALAQPLDEFTRDASIQRFEYTFELCWKMIKRYLKENINLPEGSLRDLFRQAAQQKLIASPGPWFEYQTARNLTSHTYNEMTADEVYEIAKSFAPEARKLLENLHKLSQS